MKVATITLEYVRETWTNGKHYRVAKVTDSVEYSPGDLLAKADVGGLCCSKAWKVIIRDNKD